MQPLTEDEISVYTPSPGVHINGTGQVELRQKIWVLLTWGVRQCSLGYQGGWKSSWEILKAAITERATLKYECKIPSDLRLQAGQELHWFQSKSTAGEMNVLNRYFSSCPSSSLLSSKCKPCQDSDVANALGFPLKLKKGQSLEIRVIYHD